MDEAETPELKKDYAIVIEAILKQRLLGVKNEVGVYIAPTFPKIIYTLSKSNVDPDSEYYYLTELAAKCTANRMVPDYISEKKMFEIKEGNVVAPMGCRSQLSVWKDPETGKAKFFGRWNCGVVTINLPDVALTAIDELVASKELEYSKTKDSEYESWFSNKEQQNKIKERFWKILSERLELCHRSLKIRRDRLRGTKSDVAPILWQHGAYARLKSGETIDRFLNGGYTTTSLGYVGLWETVKSITGHSHTDDEVKDFAISILKRLNDACDEWNEAENNAGYSIYGTPEESTTYKFAKTLQKHDVVIGGINDKNFVMNSYHTDIREKVDAFTKLTNESVFQEYTKGGAISYVETANLKNNIPAILSVLKHIYENTLYAELNCKLDCCMECKYEGEIPLEKNEHGKLIWKCPSCGCTDQSKMNIVRRVCGYLSNANVMNQGRLADIKNRVLHL